MKPTYEEIEQKLSELTILNEQLQANLEMEKAKNKSQNTDFYEISHSIFYKLVDKSLVGNYIIKDGKYIYVNEMFAEITGYSKEELLNMNNVLDVIAEFDKHRVKEQLDKRIRNEIQNSQYIATIKQKNGNLVFVEIFGSFILFQEHPLLFGSIANITERIKFEKNLEKERNILNDIIDYNPYSIQIIDKDGYTIRVNRAHTALFGAVPPANYSVFTDETLTEKEELNQLLSQVKDGNCVQFPLFWYDVHRIIPEFASKPVCIKMVIFPIKDSTGAIENYVLIHEDITKQKIFEIELTKNEKFNRLVVENLPSAIAVYNSNSVCTYLSLAFEKMFGYSNEEFIKKDIQKYIALVHPDDKLEVQTVFTNILQSEHGFEKRIIYRTQISTGEYRFFETFGCNYTKDSTIQGAVFHTIDITDKKAAEKEILMLLEQEQTLNEELRSTEEELRQSLDQAEFLNSSLMKSEASIQSFFDSSIQAYLFLDSDFRIIALNKLAKEDSINFWQKELELNDCIIDFLPLNIDNEIIESLNNAKKGLACRYEKYFLINEIIPIWLDIICLPVYDGNDLFIGISFSYLDITEKKLKEIEVLESEKKFRAAFENAALGMALTTLESKFIEVNSYFANMLGFKKNELTGKHASDITFQHNVEENEKFIQQVLKGEITSRSYEKQYIHKNGKIVWGFLHSTIHKDLSGRPLYFITVIVDITERKNAEEKLKLQKEFLNKIIENIPVGIFAKDVKNDFRFSIWNAKMEKLFGVKKEDMLGKNDFDLIPDKEEVQYFRNTDIDVLKNGVVVDIPFEVVNTATSSLQVHTIKVPIYDHNGEPETLLGILEDISERIHAQNLLLKAKEELEFKVLERTAELTKTNKDLKSEIAERKIIEQALRDSKELYHTLVRHFPNGIVNLIDRNQVLILSEGTEFDIFTSKEKSIIGSNIEEVFDESICSRFKELIDNAFAGNYSNIEFSIGEKFYTVQTLPVRNDKFEIYLVMQLVQNITKRKNAEDILLKAYEKERELNQMKSQFISTASHEFRTPIAGISLNTEMLQELININENPALQKCFNRIHDAIRNLTIILDDISFIAKDQSGKLDFDPTIINFEQVCIEFIEEVCTIFPKAQILPKLNSCIGNVKMDKKLLRSIFTNVLLNAIKYTDKDTPIIFETKKNTTDSVTVIIQDFGIGIPKDDLQNVFEPFHRASNTTDIKGTGLGMSIVKRCVLLHNGDIFVKSELSKGTIVTIILPFQK